jgi:hypothetical protein
MRVSSEPPDTERDDDDDGEHSDLEWLESEHDDVS